MPCLTPPTDSNITFLENPWKLPSPSHVYTRALACMWRSEDNSKELISSFRFYMGPRVWTQITRFVGQAPLLAEPSLQPRESFLVHSPPLYLPSFHPASPFMHFFFFFTKCLTDPLQVLYLMRGHSAEQNGSGLCSYVKDLILACFFPDYWHPHCRLWKGKPTSCSSIISQPHVTTKTYAERIGLLPF